MYINFDNPATLGRALSFAPYVEPFLTAHRNYSLSIRFAGGISYLDNVFHPEKILIIYSTVPMSVTC